MVRNMKKWINMQLNAAYTVEAAGVMTVVLLTVMILLGMAFHVHKEVVESMKLHTSVEQVRHAVSSKGEKEIRMQAGMGDGTLSITAPVFRPENSLRMWSLLEGDR